MVLILELVSKIFQNDPLDSRLTYYTYYLNDLYLNIHIPINVAVFDASSMRHVFSERKPNELRVPGLNATETGRSQLIAHSGSADRLVRCSEARANVGTTELGFSASTQ